METSGTGMGSYFREEKRCHRRRRCPKCFTFQRRMQLTEISPTPILRDTSITKTRTETKTVLILNFPTVLSAVSDIYTPGSCSLECFLLTQLAVTAFQSLSLPKAQITWTFSVCVLCQHRYINVNLSEQQEPSGAVIQAVTTGKPQNLYSA